MERVLIIDDDDVICAMLHGLICRTGCAVDCCKSLREALRAVNREDYAVVLLDVQMPDGSGLDHITKIRCAASRPEVIIMTGYGTLDGAEIAIRSGAWDYIQKGGSPQEITLAVRRALEHNREKVHSCARPVALKLDGIVGQSKPMHACYDQLALAAAGQASVLITGETGTGKELFARAIHINSARSRKSMVVVDCAALPETLIESLLFGHEKGAYTGADTRREGLVAQADGGTLFLDEVAEMPLATQKVFLRVLQERRYRPVGARQEQTSDFRLIAATNRDLDQLAAQGRFRKDLLYRIRGMSLVLPPLRERKEDIKSLVMHYLARFGERTADGSKGVSQDFWDAVTQYPWPGNVRELINTVEVTLAGAGPKLTLVPRHLPPEIRLHAIKKSLPHPVTVRSAEAGTAPLVLQEEGELVTFKDFRRAFVVRMERQYLQALIDSTHNRTDEALRISGLSRSRFYDLLKQHKLAICQPSGGTLPPSLSSATYARANA